MNYFDILLAKKLDKGGGGEITIEGLSVTANGTYSEEGKAYTPVVVNVEGYKLEDMPTGTIATITDAAALPLNNLKVSINPVQAGSGDPSPSNVRPITGWTEANVSLNEINQWDEQWEVGSFNMNTGEKKQDNNLIRSKNFIPILPTNNYYLKIWYSISQTGFSVLFYDKDKNFISSLKKWNPYLNTSEIPSESRYMMFKTDSIRMTYNNDISINYPSTDTSYHAYTGQTYNIEFPSEAGTVYGGTLDVTNGVLIVDRVIILGRELSWAYESESTPKLFRASLPNAPIIASQVLSSKYLSWTSGASSMPNESCGITGTQAYPYLRVRDDTYIDAATFANAVNDVQFCYYLLTPITYQLDPTSIIRLLEGLNNIFADTGDVLEGEYFKAL